MQFVKQGFRVLQIERVEALGEPAVDRSEKITGLFPLALIAPLKASGVFLLRSTPGVALPAALLPIAVGAVAASQTRSDE